MPEPWSSLVIFVITVFCEVESERFWMSRESVEYRLVRRLLDQMLNRAASIRAAQGTDPGARQGVVLRGSVAAPTEYPPTEARSKQPSDRMCPGRLVASQTAEPACGRRLSVEVLRMWHDGWQWGWGGYLAMVLMMVLFWGAVALLVVWAIRQFRPEGGSRPAPPPPGPDPVRILEERFARGEIDAEEFEQRREVLRRGAGGAP